MNILSIVRLLGFSGLYLYLYKQLKKDPPSIKIPIFGTVSTYHEVRNIFDNFGITGQMRDRKVELYLKGKSVPVVIDCGVNVGVTARWWFHLNRNSKVYGIDMLEEAEKFTVRALRSIDIGADKYRPIRAALWSDNGREFTIGVSDPLYGDYGFYRPDKELTKRTVVTKTLDSVCDSEGIGQVDLLKVDLEGAAADALKGAPELLRRTRFVVFEEHEVHNRDECRLATDILNRSGFHLMRRSGRHLWWEKGS